jgi:hypothetical protein
MRFPGIHEITARLLTFPRMRSGRSGLILIQIDGLSRVQLDRALAAGRMPFLRNLIASHNYRLHSMFSGIPSSTPAFQGELFYGVPNAVPAFGFVHKPTSEMFHMLMTRNASVIQEELEQKGTPLLRGGSAYSDIYNGGAARASFCSVNRGFGGNFRRLKTVWALPLILVLHSFVILRIVALFIIEFVLAVMGLFQGIISRQNFSKELSFIPARVGICILLRELVVAGVTVDMALGIPVIHCNFLGYDEQSHRRGPSSRFAHWTLRGIDDSIRRIHATAQRLDGKDYRIWIYSDHGQEQTVPYPQLYGATIHEAVNRTLKQIGFDGCDGEVTNESEQGRRASLLGPGMFKRLYPQPRYSTTDVVRVASIGPLAHVYLCGTPSQELLEKTAAALVKEAGVPMVLFKNDNGSVIAVNDHGRWILPGHRARVLGEDHPFLDQTASDLVALVHHRDAGTLVLSGWRPNGHPVSFPIESGAHAGPGSHETHAFILLPSESGPGKKTSPWRAADLRKAAELFLGRAMKDHRCDRA